MMFNQIDCKNWMRSWSAPWRCQNGFTLVELMIGIAITAIISTGILVSYITIAKLSREQNEKALMQINQRGSVENFELEIRMAGYDPQDNGNFGVWDVRQYNVTDENTAPVPALIPGSSPALTVVYDNLTAPNGIFDATDTFISFRLFDEGNDGSTALARDRRTGDGVTFTVPREVLAENILAVGFAYAYDSDGDGQLDTATPGGTDTIWAVDTDNDNVLDSNLDTNGDGNVDFTDGIGSIALPGGVTVARGFIRIVKIWLLAGAEKPTKGYLNTNQYKVGGRILSVANGDFREGLKCSLLVRSIEFRNIQ